MRWEFDCAVIGGGPGGLVSALYLRRFGRKIVLFNEGKPRAAWIPRTHNLIGYEKGISGRELLARLGRQVTRLGLERVSDQGRVERWHGGFRIKTARGDCVYARKVILATGIEDRQPAVDRLQELREKGLLRYCSICDGYEYRGEPIAVLARDGAGIDKALFLLQWTRDVRLVYPPTMPISVRRLRALKRFRGLRLCPCQNLQLKPEAGARGVTLRLDELVSQTVRVVYVELGCRVRDEAFRDLKGLRLSRDGFILTGIEQRTTIPGLFAVGDCVNTVGQISVAAGQAAIASTAAHNDLIDWMS